MKGTFRERFQYWFDNHMAAGTRGMTWMLAGTMVLLVCLLAGAAMIFHVPEERGLLTALWDSLAAIVNADVPSSEEGDVSYVVLMAISAAIGLLFTSVLIGIINNAIEEKLAMLRKGNSMVLEKDHTVVLGFMRGEYALISQLVLAAEGKDACIVIAEAMDREEMEEAILENVAVPENVRIICRRVDICDPNALAICSLETCRNIVVAPGENGRTLKTVLAVTSLLGEEEKEKIHIVAAVSKDEYMLPVNMAGKNGVLMLQTYDVAARVIAHACTQPGLSEAFTDIFNFEGSELYLCQLPGSEGKSFAQLMNCVDGGIPLGICRNGVIMLHPSVEEVVEQGDTVLMFAETEESAHLTQREEIRLFTVNDAVEEEPEGSVLIVGFGEALDTVLQELPENIYKIRIASFPGQEGSALLECVEQYPERKISVVQKDLAQESVLEELAQKTDHVILLSNYEIEEEAADIQIIRLLLRLRDIKTRLGLDFTITAEMRREGNRNLVVEDDLTDFIVASNMSSMILAQLVENPLLYGVFYELLSNVGNEIYLKTAASLGCDRVERTIAEMRMKALSRGYLLLGYIGEGSKSCAVHLNPPLEERVILSPEERLIVIGEQ